ncbi:TolC family outer membrane protein [Parasphingopyxis algicola]|uniref:TolC family outer membrane protein n=1 Tax=Parasphingopyxis algicola TaxID=2026624 RepID=UPI0015A25FFE|nr:TolC family outer membrane protein [Parasphingopyxis algicola]QLC24009.1 TolC family outer membrane protein [Parasphingopyxis algicola]
MAPRANTLLIGVAAAALMLATPAPAETLRDALLEAYQTNPTLNAARAGQRANDENVPLTLADGRPSVSVTGFYNENVRTSANSFTAPARNTGAQADVTLPIFQGGTVRNRIRAARERVEAGQADLRSTEANLFTNVVAAYLDVISNRNIVDLNANQVRVLDTNLQATSDRFEIGDLTRTDVAQAEARLSTARANLDTAQAELAAAEENYLQLVGEWPQELEPPPPLPDLPDSPDAAEDIAIVHNPDLIAAQLNAEAARRDIAAARGSRLPTLEAFARGNYNNFLDTLGSPALTDEENARFFQEETTATVGLRATLPIYQGGRPAAQVRRTQALRTQAMETVIATERAVVADVRAAFSRYRASLQVIDATQTAVEANELALEGVRAENSVGLRTILDILNAEQELLNSQVDLVTARRNAYVAGFNLLAAMGQAEAQDLGLDGGVLYDPNVNYERVDDQWFDWNDDPRPVTQSTRTVDNPQRVVTNPEN